MIPAHEIYMAAREYAENSPKYNSLIVTGIRVAAGALFVANLYFMVKEINKISGVNVPRDETKKSDGLAKKLDDISQ